MTESQAENTKKQNGATVLGMLRKQMNWFEGEENLKKKNNSYVQQAKDYTNNSSIHGLYYVGEDGRSMVERFIDILKNFIYCIFF